MSALAAFAFQLPSLASFLPSVDSATLHGDQTQPPSDLTLPYDHGAIDHLISELDIPSARISHPDVVPILLRLAWTHDSGRTSYALAKLIDRLAATTYGNRAALAQTHIVRLVWDRLYPYPPSSSSLALPAPETNVLQKVMRRVLELGAPLDDMKLLFRRTGETSGGARLKALGLLKGNPHARWPSFLALRGENAGIDVKNVVGRGRGLFGNAGISILVCLFSLRLYAQLTWSRPGSILNIAHWNLPTSLASPLLTPDLGTTLSFHLFSKPTDRSACYPHTGNKQTQ